MGGARKLRHQVISPVHGRLVTGPGRASTHRPGLFCWCRSTVTEVLDIVQNIGKDVAVPENPESEGSRLITLKQIEQEHGVSRSALHTYRLSSTFPQPVPVEGSTKTLFHADEVAAWFRANPKQQGKKRDRFVSQQQGDPMTTTTDPRIAVLSAISSPDWHPVPEAHGMPWDEAVKLLDAYRAAVLREVAAEIEGIDAHPNATGRHADIYKALAHRFRRQADTITEEVQGE